MVKKQSKTKTGTSQKTGQTDSIRLAFFGSSGSGKTYRAKQLTKGLKRLVVFDPTPEIDWRSECDFVGKYDDVLDYISNHFDSEFRCCLIPEFGKEELELDSLCLFLIEIQRSFHRHRAKITLVVDELDMSFNTGTSLKNKKSYFAYLCRRGRHLGVNLLGISQRINQVDTAFRSNLSGVYLFQHTEQIDIRQCLQMLSKEHHQTFLNLAPRQYIYKAGALQKIFTA